MSSTYQLICMNHDPGIVVWDDHHQTFQPLEEKLKSDDPWEHSGCDVVIGRFSYPLIEVGCPWSLGKYAYRCEHAATMWTEASWLKLLFLHAVSPESSLSSLAPTVFKSIPRCWTPGRVMKLRTFFGDEYVNAYREWNEGERAKG